MNERPASPTDDRPFFRSMLVLIRHWRFLAVCFVAAAIVSGAISFLIPNTYNATASFLPPQKQSGLLESVTSGLTSTFKSFGISKPPGTASGVYSYLSILGSRTLAERIIRKFDLFRVYEISDSSMERAVKALHDNLEVTLEEEGHITVSIEDRDPARAAELANTAVAFLQEINTTLNISEARSNRIFVEQQYNSVMTSLQSVEDSMVLFSKRTGIYSLPEQTKAAMTAMASLRAQLMYQQVAVGVAEKMFGADDADVQLAKTKLMELEKNISQSQSNPGVADLLPSMKDLPKEGVQYLRLYRDYEIYSKVLAFLLPLLQQAKVDEQKETNSLVVLDRAIRPERKSKPKRSIIIAVATLSVFVLAIAFLLIRERIAFFRAMNPDDWQSVRRSFGRRS